jgi:hypothetical protein
MLGPRGATLARNVHPNTFSSNTTGRACKSPSNVLDVNEKRYLGTKDTLGRRNTRLIYIRTKPITLVEVVYYTRMRKAKQQSRGSQTAGGRVINGALYSIRVLCDENTSIPTGVPLQRDFHPHVQNRHKNAMDSSDSLNGNLAAHHSSVHYLSSVGRQGVSIV